MKKIRSAAFAVSAVFCMFLSLNASAQKLHFTNDMSRKIVDENTVAFEGTVDNVATAAEASAFASKIAAGKGIVKAEATSFADGKAKFTVHIVKKQPLYVFQNALLTAHVKSIYVDTKPVPTIEMVNVIKSMRRK